MLADMAVIHHRATKDPWRAWFIDEPLIDEPCDVAGRGGFCQRLIGHPEDDWRTFPQGMHVSWDTGHWTAWPTQEVAAEDLRI